jgi:hypothetical protein
MAESAADPAVVATFNHKHQEHTGHEVEWTDIDLPNGFRPGQCYEVRCFECMTRHREPTEAAAQGWASEHDEFTDHSSDKIKTVEMDPLSEDSVNQLIEFLSGFFGHGVPRTLLVSILADCHDVEKEEAQDALERLLIVGACYEPADGRIAAI